MEKKAEQSPCAVALDLVVQLVQLSSKAAKVVASVLAVVCRFLADRLMAV